ncbi:thiamine pyrophosphate-binding protein [Clostridium sp. AF18-27]|uniref:thiamine pyrophosphate-binding protein n=1 Tax=Enterocloster lavalensis TaxID=460384 RepID=UPI000E524B88|nr:thiamine pyrophosphate-binding protein [Enterocloster lavalensis]RHR54036.1 thiamine pyrophosphate-binding protein [Clostridium sp. AF18-27]
MKLSGGQIVMKYLEKEKVPYVLGIPGHGILSFFDALKESEQAGNVKYIQVKHEQTAVHIADGYYRIKGEPLATFTSIGPGALNTVIGLGTAYVDSVPVFQVNGDTHTNMKGVGVLQEIERAQDSNFIRVMEPVTKRCWRAESVNQLPRMMQRAFNQMTTGRKGPVVIGLPMDVAADVTEVNFDEIGTRRTGAKPAGQQEYIDTAVEMMKEAKRPVIIVGGSVLRSNMEDQLIELAELWGAAVVTTMAGKSAFPEDHPLNGFHTGSKGTPVGLKLTREADVILALGTRFADETTSSYREGVGFSFSRTKLIQVDIESAEIGKNYPCACGIIGDVSVVAGQLIKAYRETVSVDRDYMDRPYTKEILALKQEWAEILTKKRSVEFEHPTISQVIGIMNECLPENTIIATSSGNTQAQLFQEYCFKNGQKHLTTGGFSTMGWAMPAAIGAKLAKPEAPVVALLGDGDFMMTMQEMSVMAQYDIPVVVVLLNNSAWMAIKDLQADVFGQEYMFGNDFMKDGALYSPKFAEIAENFGLHAEKVDKKKDVEGAIERAIASGKPALVEVTVHRDYPESGGVAYGWWDMPVPAYMEDRREKFVAARAEETV